MRPVLRTVARCKGPVGPEESLLQAGEGSGTPESGRWPGHKILLGRNRNEGDPGRLGNEHPSCQTGWLDGVEFLVAVSPRFPSERGGHLSVSPMNNNTKPQFPPLMNPAHSEPAPTRHHKHELTQQEQLSQ